MDYQRSYDLCLRKNIVGIGWQVTDSYSRPPLSLRDYLAQGAVLWPNDGSWNTAINRLRAMDQHDLVWIRSPKPYHYHLCRIVGPWDYRDASEYREVDIVNVRPVEIIEIEATAVPREIEPRFQGGSTIEPIKDQHQLDATIELWHKYHADAPPMAVEGMLSLTPAKQEPPLQSPEFQGELQELVASLKAHAITASPRIFFRDAAGAAAYLTGVVTVSGMLCILAPAIRDILVAYVNRNKGRRATLEFPGFKASAQTAEEVREMLEAFRKFQQSNPKRKVPQSNPRND